MKSVCLLLVGLLLSSGAHAGLVGVNLQTRTECGTSLAYGSGNGFADHRVSDGLYFALSELTGFDHSSHHGVASVLRRDEQSAKAWTDFFLHSSADEISFSSEYQGLVRLGAGAERSTARYESSVGIEVVFDTDTAIEVSLGVSAGALPLGAFAADLEIAGIEGALVNRVEIDSSSGGSDQSQTLKVRGTVLAGNCFTIHGSGLLEMDSSAYGEGTLVGTMFAEIRVLPAPGTLVVCAALGIVRRGRRR